MPAATDPMLAEVTDTYRRFLHLFGPSHEGVGWRRADGQRQRFELLCRIIDDDPGRRRPFSVADYGCGYGALLPVLAERYGDRLAAYHGYDVCPEMLAAARGAHADPRARWLEASDLAETVDYVLVSGTFNIKGSAADEVWRRWVEDRLVHLFRRCRRGLAFNMLSTDGERRGPDLYYTAAGPWLDMARERMTRRLALLQDYPLAEWTLLLRHA